MNKRDQSLLDIIRLNGRLIRKEHNLLFTPKRAETEYKSDNTPVTRVDLAINDSLMAWARRHDCGYVGEEGNGALDKKHILYVDSLDGTIAFTRTMNTATVIATVMLMDDKNEIGTPVSSIIHQPLGNHTWVSCIDSLTYYYGPLCPQGVAVCVPPTTPEKIRANICVFPGTSYNLKATSEYIYNDSRFSNQQMGAFGYGGGLIASGLLEATAIAATAATESAAMSLIVSNAGGIACDLLGNPLTSFTFGEVCGKPDFELPKGALFASNQKVADSILKIVAECN
jgi:3'(2'), 5'-bisphosphate nucleotidase